MPSIRKPKDEPQAEAGSGDEDTATGGILDFAFGAVGELASSALDVAIDAASSAGEAVADAAGDIVSAAIEGIGDALG